MFNLFRLTADLSHLLSFILLILNIRRSKNCIGLSCKTQILLLLVFCTRYLDLIYRFSHQNLYLIVMKTLFISAPAYIIFLMKFSKPYCESSHILDDNYKNWKSLIYGALVATIIIHRDWTFTDLIWSFSIWLEAVAIVPQLHMLIQNQQIENLTAHYIGTLGLYRLLYLFNWVYRYSFEDHFCWTSVCAGSLQAAIFGYFLHHYLKIADQKIEKTESNIENETTIDSSAQYPNLEGETMTGPLLQQHSI